MSAGAMLVLLVLGVPCTVSTALLFARVHATGYDAEWARAARRAWRRLWKTHEPLNEGKPEWERTYQRLARKLEQRGRRKLNEERVYGIIYLRPLERRQRREEREGRSA